jgi:uncharacterized DUF497 family protein
VFVLFEWDERKNASNRKKHGVSFEVATAVFDDPMHVTTPEHEAKGEIRWRTVGAVHGRYLLVVAHTLIEEGEEIVRIISARAATAHERREYEEELYR